MNLINLLRGRQNKKSERNNKNLEKLRNLGINKELSTYKVSTVFAINFKATIVSSVSTRKESYKIFRFFFRMMLHNFPGSEESIAKEVFHKSGGKSLSRADFDFCLHGTTYDSYKLDVH